MKKLILLALMSCLFTGCWSGYPSKDSKAVYKVWAKAASGDYDNISYEDWLLLKNSGFVGPSSNDSPNNLIIMCLVVWAYALGRISSGRESEKFTSKISKDKTNAEEKNS